MHGAAFAWISAAAGVLVQQKDLMARLHRTVDLSPVGFAVVAAVVEGPGAAVLLLIWTSRLPNGLQLPHP